jgi:hypothetical protein
LTEQDASIRTALLGAPVKTWQDIAHSDKVDISLNGVPVVLDVTTMGSLVQAVPGNWSKSSYNDDAESGIFVYSLEDKNIDVLVAGDAENSIVIGAEGQIAPNMPLAIAGMDLNLAEKDLPTVFGRPTNMEANDQGRTYTFNIVVGDNEYMLDLTFGNDGKMSNVSIKTYGFMEYSAEMTGMEESDVEEPDVEEPDVESDYVDIEEADELEGDASDMDEDIADVEEDTGNIESGVAVNNVQPK